MLTTQDSGSVRNHAFVYLLMVLVSILFAGCSGLGDKIVDWTPVNIIIEAVDSEGNSIISPEMPGMSLTFKGETYTVKPEGTRTKAYLAVIYGLIAQPMYEIDDKTIYRLVFGEIDGAEDMDEDILLHWPDGSEDLIQYHCSNHRQWPSIKCDRSWKLNGKPHDGGVFRFSGKSI